MQITQITRYCTVLLGLYLDLGGTRPCLNSPLLQHLGSLEFAFAREHCLAEGGDALSWLHLLRLAINEEPDQRKIRLEASVPMVWASVKARGIKGPLTADGTVAWSFVDAVASEVCTWESAVIAECLAKRVSMVLTISAVHA